MDIDIVIIVFLLGLVLGLVFGFSLSRPNIVT